METAFARDVVGAPVAFRNAGLAAVFAALKPILAKPFVFPLLGLPYWGWLNKLKASTRICSLNRSVRRINLDRDRSILATPGPRQSPTGALPMVASLRPFKVYRFWLIHWNWLEKLELRQGCPATMFGRYAPSPRPMPEISFTPDPAALKPLMTGV